jgi:hypothetical protein
VSKAGTPVMLPGLRFLLIAILFSSSVSVFGLGAASLMRAAHEAFASNPSWRAPPETIFVQTNEARPPVLAMLQVEPPASLQPPASAPDQVLPPLQLPEPVATASAPAASSAEIPRDDEANAPVSGTAPDAIDQPVVASVETGLQPTDLVTPFESKGLPATPEQSSIPAPSPDIASTGTASLDTPSATIETPSQAKATANKTNAVTDQRAAEKRLRKRRAAERRRMALGARMAQQAQQTPAVPTFEPLTPAITP